MTTTLEKTSAPAPGIYRGVDPDEYHAWNCVNASALKPFLAKCPASALAALRKPQKDKEAFILGTGAHAACLEPKRYAEEFVVGPDVKLNTKEGKAAWEAFTQANPGKRHIRGGDAINIDGMRKAVWSHQYASKILALVTDVELSLVWVDELTGLTCKARPDLWCGNHGVMPDFKTARSVKPADFERDAHEYGYHIQLAFYARGAAALGLDVRNSPIIAVESEDPYNVIVFEPDATWKAFGESEAERGLLGWKSCLDTGIFPGYVPDNRTEALGLPAWAIKNSMR